MQIPSSYFAATALNQFWLETIERFSENMFKNKATDRNLPFIQRKSFHCCNSPHKKTDCVVVMTPSSQAWAGHQYKNFHCHRHLRQARPMKRNHWTACRLRLHQRDWNFCAEEFMKSYYMDSLIKKRLKQERTQSAVIWTKTNRIERRIQSSKTNTDIPTSSTAIQTD